MEYLLIVILSIICLVLALRGFTPSQGNESESDALRDQVKSLYESLTSKVGELERVQGENHRLNVEVQYLKSNQTDLTKIVDRGTHDELKNSYSTLVSDYENLQSKYSTVVSKRKSDEVRLGAIAETLTPFLEGFPYNPKNLRALGSPIDYVAFEEDEVVFIEVKSGNSKLSGKQKHIKELVESGKVRFEEHRIGEEGLKIE